MRQLQTPVIPVVEGSSRIFVEGELKCQSRVDNVSSAERILDEMLKAHAEYLPQF